MTHQDSIAQPNGSSQRRLYDLTKRFFDIALALLALILLSPVLLIISILIKIDSPGPIFYRQRRIGQWGKPFNSFRFRTMNTGLDQEKQISHHNRSGEAVFKLVNDPRMTSVGMFLRKTSMDELPQLFNVLRGEISLVGPRPLLEYEVELYKDWDKHRLDAIPGITGIWQVHGANYINFDEMVKSDIWYIEHRSFWLDLKLLLETLLASLRGRNTY
jgi:lipopolysaccharide/colanic/teichoic acid biosynthesis glycosyltransferase